MIVITKIPLMKLIPDDLLGELIGVRLNVVENKHNVVIVHKEDILAGLKEMNRNYALQYFKKAIHFLGTDGLIPISKDFIQYVV